MKSNSRPLKLFLIFISLGFIPIQLLQASNVGTLYAYSELEAIVDGVTEEDIWKSSRALDITLYEFDDQTDTKTISIMSVYEEVNGSITFAIEVPDSTESIDYFCLVFKTNLTADFMQYTTEWDIGWGFNIGNDLKVYSASQNEGTDWVTDTYYIDGGQSDTQRYGFDNVEGAHTHNGTHYTIELKTDLDSRDYNGADFSLAHQDTIEFSIMYFEDSSTKLYSLVREDDNEWDNYVLCVGKKGLLGPNSFFIAACFISTFVVFSYITRKRKRSISK